MAIGRSSWWGRVNPQPIKLKKRYIEQHRQKLPWHKDRRGMPTRQSEKDTHHHEIGAMAPMTRTKKLGMAPNSRGTTLSSIDVAQPTESGSEHESDHSRKNLVRSRGKGSMFPLC
jgi:hypothetical protein